MSDKIQLRFKLDNLQKIGFEPGSLDQEFFDGLQQLQVDGIAINTIHYDELCKSTISNGHNLLKSDGIFNLNTSVVGSMAETIGQYLFRLLFNDATLYNRLWKARIDRKQIEIKLEFDTRIPDSAALAKLPWELMYCPVLKPAAGDDDNDLSGFFLAKETFLYREYVKKEDNVNEEPRELCVAVAFLIKDIENLEEVCLEFKKIAAKISANNRNIQFAIINEDENGEFFLLTKKDLEKIFLSEINNNQAKQTNKIIHIVCDVNPYDNSGAAEKSLFFKKKDTETEPISFKEVFRELVNKVLITDTAVKMLVLQAWKDESYSAYAGFEEFTVEMLKRNKTAVVSMPYLLKQERNDNGKSKFFNILYGGLSASRSIRDVMMKLRDEMMPGYSYGFPLFYFNGYDGILVSSPVNTRPSNDNISMPETVREDKRRKELMEEYRNLDADGLQENMINVRRLLKANLTAQTAQIMGASEKEKLAIQNEGFNLKISVFQELLNLIGPGK